jgi:hypothetical protein
MLEAIVFDVLWRLAGELVTIFLYAAGPVLALGVPTVLASVRLPPRLGVQAVKEEELADHQLAAFREIDALMAPQGFTPGLTFTATELQGRSLARAYVSSGDPALALAAGVSTTQEAGTHSENFFELETEFEDGTLVHTRNTRSVSPFENLPRVEMHEHPEIRNPLTLKLKHDAYCARHRAKGAKFYRAEQLEERIEADHAEQMEHQVACGRFAPTKDGKFRLTVSNAVRQVIGFVNPFQDPRLHSRAASLLLLVILPIATVAAVDLPYGGLSGLISAWLPTLSPELATYAALIPLVAAGSVAIGLALGSKAVIWTIFLTLVEIRILMPDGLPGLSGFLATLVLIAGAVKVSLMTSHAVNRRRDLT